MTPDPPTLASHAGITGVSQHITMPGSIFLNFDEVYLFLLLLPMVLCQVHGPLLPFSFSVWCLRFRPLASVKLVFAYSVKLGPGFFVNKYFLIPPNLGCWHVPARSKFLRWLRRSHSTFVCVTSLVGSSPPSSMRVGETAHTHN